MPHARHFALLVVAVSSLTMNCAALADEPRQVAAVFKLQEVQFVYRTMVNFLACDELRRDVGVILRAMGARDDVAVRVNNCELMLTPDQQASARGWDRFHPERLPDPTRSSFDDDQQQQHSTVYIKVMFPIEATADVMKEIEHDKSRRDLISRVTGDPTAANNDPIMFPAERKQITLSQGTLRLRPEHCELLEQMMPSLARKLDVKVISKQVSCDRYGRSELAPKVTVEVLWPSGAPVPGEKREKK